MSAATDSEYADIDPQEIERLLAELGRHPDPSVGESVEELARLLMAMYGAGLARVVALLAGAGGPGHRLLGELVDDDLVAGLLVLHDLHPEDTTARATRALDSVRPYLGSHAGGVELLGVVEEPDGKVVQLRLQGSCDGCQSSAVTVTMAIEKAIVEACPEVVRVEVEGLVTEAEERPKELPVLQIGTCPPVEDVPVSWVALELPELSPEQCTTVELVGASVLLALPASGELVTYRDECPSCRRSLAGAALRGDELTCACCAVAFDVRLAGRALDGSARHLDPLPLVHRAGGWKLAIPRVPAAALP